MGLFGGSRLPWVRVAADSWSELTRFILCQQASFSLGLVKSPDARPSGAGGNYDPIYLVRILQGRRA